MKLILVRHGETRLNQEGRIQGISSTPLSAAGRAQARAVAGALVADLPFVLYTSPLARAVETAQLLCQRLQVPLTPVRSLEEADAGWLEGLNAEEVRGRYPEFAARWAEDAGSTAMPGGESLLQVQKRAWAAVTELMAQHNNETVVAVTHNFTIQTILCIVLEVPLRHSRRLRVNAGSMTRLELSPSQRALVSLNETWHLKDLQVAADGHDNA